jgi:hypothetical protein
MQALFGAAGEHVIEAPGSVRWQHCLNRPEVCMLEQPSRENPSHHEPMHAQITQDVATSDALWGMRLARSERGSAEAPCCDNCSGCGWVAVGEGCWRRMKLVACSAEMAPRSETRCCVADSGRHTRPQGVGS